VVNLVRSVVLADLCLEFNFIYRSNTYHRHDETF